MKGHGSDSKSFKEPKAQFWKIVSYPLKLNEELIQVCKINF